MADEELVEYIRENKTKHGLEKLRRGLLEQGLSYKEIQEAIDVVENETSEKISEVFNFADSEEIVLDEEPKTEENINEIQEKKDLDSQILEPRSSFDNFEREHIRRKKSKFNFLSSLSKLGGKTPKKEDLDRYKKKINKTFDMVAGGLGIKDRDKKFYIDAAKYGAISFLFLAIISSLFRYFAGKAIYEKAFEKFGDEISLHVPDIFLLKVDLYELIPSIILSTFIGGAVYIIYLKYLVSIWPFSNFNKFSTKTFIFLLIFNIIFGLIFNGIFSSMLGVYFLGYLIILVGIIISSYLSAEFFSNNMEKKYDDIIKIM